MKFVPHDSHDSRVEPVRDLKTSIGFMIEGVELVKDSRVESGL